MKLQNQNRYALASIAMVGILGATLFAGSGGPTPCYKDFTKSCGKLHATENRTCGVGDNRTPCGDVITTDNLVKDIRAAATNESGRRKIRFDDPVTVWIDFWYCDTAQQCKFSGNDNRTCQGREEDPASAACTGI